MSLAALLLPVALAAAPSSAAERVRVECEGPVRYDSEPDGKTRLALAGGVKVRRGETALQAREAQAVLAEDGGPPEVVRAEGEVVFRSPAFSARADAAEIRTTHPADRDGEGRGEFDVRLERGELAEVELRSGEVLVACRGPLSYSSTSRVARLTGGVRAESPRLRARSREATVVLRRASPEEAEKNGEQPEDTPALPAVESVELVGEVVLNTPQQDGAEPRRMRAERAFYDAGEDTIAFTGRPDPVVEYGGVALTAPEIVLHLRDNRIVPRGGKMRAVLDRTK